MGVQDRGAAVLQVRARQAVQQIVSVGDVSAVRQGEFEFAVFSRSDYDCWQGIAGGGEDEETPLQAARREALEEAGIPTGSAFLLLDTVASVPVTFVLSRTILRT